MASSLHRHPSRTETSLLPHVNKLFITGRPHFVSCIRPGREHSLAAVGSRSAYDTKRHCRNEGPTARTTGASPVSIGGVGAGDGDRADGSSPRLEWIRDREPGSPRVTVFDPDPARLDTAWIEIDAPSTVALRAMR